MVGDDDNADDDHGQYHQTDDESGLLVLRRLTLPTAITRLAAVLGWLTAGVLGWLGG